jgi:hypothetical protein
LNRQLVVRSGVHYQLHEKVSLSIGAATNPLYYTFGTSLKWKRLQMDFATSIHEVLGITPHLGLSFPVKK